MSSDAALGSRASVADGGEGRFDDAGGSKVRPVRGGEVVEREQLIAVTGQAGGGLGVLVVALEPLVECALGVRPRLGYPDLVQPLVGFGLAGFREVVQGVPGLVEPAALGTGLWKHFRQCRPEPQCPVTDGELGRAGEAVLFPLKQHLAPALGGLAHPVLDGQEVLLAACVDPAIQRLRTLHCPDRLIMTRQGLAVPPPRPPMSFLLPWSCEW